MCVCVCHAHPRLQQLLTSQAPLLVVYGWIIVALTVDHYVLIAVMLAGKFWYHLDGAVLSRIRRYVCVLSHVCVVLIHRHVYSAGMRT